MWGNGPYERITNTIRDIHQLVIDRIDPRPGERLLDAATGTGAVAILAAKRGADVSGQDIAPVLIETARERTAEEGADIEFEVGDAEDMRYDDASFDVVSSTCGVMFAPDHAAVAGEVARVTRSGGRSTCATLLEGAFTLAFGRHESPLVLDSSGAYWELFSTSYGPTKSAVEALEPARREEFHRAWIEFGDQYLEGGQLVHRREYLLTLGTRR